jgi:hypothetical protein
MLREAGFHDAACLGRTGYRSSSVTEGMLFAATRAE